ncbi:hypothetical protein LCGC14_2513590, partial [marine sediment metagenome]
MTETEYTIMATSKNLPTSDIIATFSGDTKQHAVERFAINFPYYIPKYIAITPYTDAGYNVAHKIKESTTTITTYEV